MALLPFATMTQSVNWAIKLRGGLGFFGGATCRCRPWNLDDPPGLHRLHPKKLGMETNLCDYFVTATAEKRGINTVVAHEARGPHFVRRKLLRTMDTNETTKMPPVVEDGESSRATAPGLQQADLPVILVHDPRLCSHVKPVQASCSNASIEAGKFCEYEALLGYDSMI